MAQLYCQKCSTACIIGMQLRKMGIKDETPEQWSSESCPHTETRMELSTEYLQLIKNNHISLWYGPSMKNWYAHIEFDNGKGGHSYTKSGKTPEEALMAAIENKP